jgi:hypothetical protein
LRPSSHRALRRLKSLRCVATAATQALRRDTFLRRGSIPFPGRNASRGGVASRSGDEGPQLDRSSGLGFLCLTVCISAAGAGRQTYPAARLLSQEAHPHDEAQADDDRPVAVRDHPARPAPQQQMRVRQRTKNDDEPLRRFSSCVASRFRIASRSAAHCGPRRIAHYVDSRHPALRCDPPRLMPCVATFSLRSHRFQLCNASRGSVASRSGERGAAAKRLLGPRTPLPNGSGVLLPRATRWQVQDLAHNLAASLPVRKRATSSADYQPAPGKDHATWQPAQ